MRITYLAPVKYAQGKWCKHEDMYLAHNRKTGTNYSARICEKRCTPATATELATRSRFKAAVAAARADMQKDGADQIAIMQAFKNQNKYKTLFGYLVATNYEKLS